MRIRIIKTPPAPLMDGFDVRNLFAGQIHEVDGGHASDTGNEGSTIDFHADLLCGQR